TCFLQSPICRWLQDLICCRFPAGHTPSPTAPFASSIGAHAVTLGWKPANVAGVKYVVQWQFSRLPGSWSYTEPVSEPVYTAQPLHAFTEYTFRVVWIVTAQLHLSSPPSTSYRTLATGVPETAPLIRELCSVSPDVVEVGWSLPLFPGGPVTGYNLRLASDHQTLDAGTQATSFQFSSVLPNTTYRFSIRAVGQVDQGPEAEANVTTAPSSTVQEQAQWLFLSRENSLRKRFLEHFVEEAHCLPTDGRNETGIAVNVQRQLVYFCEGNVIWVKDATDMGDASGLHVFYNGSGTVSSVSVDWLYGKIYFIMSERVWNCDLALCSVPEDITPPSIVSLKKLVVDPYNGFIFYLVDAGVFRVDLGPRGSGEAAVEDARPVLSSRALQDFAVSFRSQQLVYFNLTDRVFTATALDGSARLALTPPTTLADVSSLAHGDGALVVTDGRRVFRQEGGRFNELIVDCSLVEPEEGGGLGNLVLLSPSIQPYPLPSRPRSLVALFGSQEAAIRWRPPSPSAWQNWTYDVQVSGQALVDGASLFPNVTDTQLVISALRNNTQYSVTVRARSPAGTGPWAEPFVGTTLKPAVETPFILAVGPDGLWQQPLTGFGPGELLSSEIRNVSGLDWHGGTLFYSDSSGNVWQWRPEGAAGGPVKDRVPGITGAGALAFEWMGQHLYWASKANLIQRRSFRTGRRDTVVRARFSVNDLAVDSSRGYLYWTTARSVESARLNGEDSLVLQLQPPFSDKQVMALTPNLGGGLLYWLVRDNQCTHLYSAPLRGHQGWSGEMEGANVTKFAQWSLSAISQPALTYYSGRLFWIDGLGFLTSQEVAQNTAVPVSDPAEFSRLTLVHQSLRPLPGNVSSRPEVIPSSVPASSFRIDGNASSFRVLWSAPPPLGWGAIFYCAELGAHPGVSGKWFLFQAPVQKSPVLILEGLAPYSPFLLSVTPYSYWGKGPQTTVTLRAPQSVPSAPENPRIFTVSRRGDKHLREAGLEFRWDKPRQDNGALENFEIFYQLSGPKDANEITRGWVVANVSSPGTTFRLEDVGPEHIIRFQVRAFTCVGPGPFSEVAEFNTSETHLVPHLVTVHGDQLALLDTDQHQTMWSVQAKEAIGTVGYLADKETVFVTCGGSLLLLHVHNNVTSEKLFEGALVHDTTAVAVDWISRHLFLAWKTVRNETQIWAIDLERRVKSLRDLEIRLGSKNSTVVSFSVYPFLSRLYWTEASELGHQMFYHDIARGTQHRILGHPVGTPAPGRCRVAAPELGGALAIDSSDPLQPLIYFIRGRHEVWATDPEGGRCQEVARGLALPGDSVTVDEQFLYWTVEVPDGTVIYQADKRGGTLRSHLATPGWQRILASSPALQPLPEKACVDLVPSLKKPTVLSTTNTSLKLLLPPAVARRPCPGITGPTPTYLVHYGLVTDNQQPEPRTQVRRLHYVLTEFQEPIALLEGLNPFSNYTIRVTVMNYFSDPHEEPPLGEEIQGTTQQGVPGAVDSVRAAALSDTSIGVSWGAPRLPNGPRASVRYQIAVDRLPPSPEIPLNRSLLPGGRLTWAIRHLSSGRRYQLKVLACHPEEPWCTESPVVAAETARAPERPLLLLLGNTSLQLAWKAPAANLTAFWFELQKWEYQERFRANAMCSPGPEHTCTITGLRPSTGYGLRVFVEFVGGAKSASPSASFKTTAGVPERPGIPKLLEGNKNSVQWKEAEDNGSNLTYHLLEIRKIINNNNNNTNSWAVVFNGSCQGICTWKSQHRSGVFQFRAAAANRLGLGEYSGISEDISLVKGTPLSPETGPGLVWKGRSRKLPPSNPMVLVQEDKELADLRGRDNVGLAKACYAIQTLPTRHEIECLPAFPRDQLTLKLLLGSGAFGEVYEGTALDILGEGSGETKVAVKTLKKGATDQEKMEFLKEAHLMSKFDHPNILKQLGVCLFNEPQYLILELMEGGDLLTYLRRARVPTFQAPLLSLVDLVELCVDISEGCVYLEKMHFIHRDLAARNCLMSVKDYGSLSRKVKIGDFGLARDVYKQDYYRKRGEGLLPIRWMAPESLVDGIFTTRSDVWAFGVLVWEILTLGHQPYPGQSNLEVLHLVQTGGRLEKPRACPSSLWDLLSQCWADDPSQRPSFGHLRDSLRNLQASPLDQPSRGGDTGAPRGVANEAFEGKKMVSMVTVLKSPCTWVEALPSSSRKRDFSPRGCSIISLTDLPGWDRALHLLDRKERILCSERTNLTSAKGEELALNMINNITVFVQHYLPRAVLSAGVDTSK
uniref:Tyrosine-protein kinase receptor n=1 Tax=Ornithorhynchus anatinus TaxID=9258 RepID=A0A6I8PJL7_ORNAN